jgi:uncharacterized protein YcbX
MMRFREIQPGSDFDVRRFRMNVIIDCEQAGFAENEWIHQLLEIGSEVRLKVTQPNARCVMTTTGLSWKTIAVFPVPVFMPG